MNCPTCGSDDNRVLRTYPEGETIARLRECLGCGKRWPTAEVPQQVFTRARGIVQAFEALETAVGPRE